VDRFALIIASACKAVGEAQNRGLPGPIAALIWTYLQRLKRRFAKLAEMALDGTLKPPRPRKPRIEVAAADDAPNEGAPNEGAPNEGTPNERAPTAGSPNAGAPERPKRRPRAKPLIRTWGWRWIARRAQYTDVFGGHLAMLLEDPEMIRLIGLDRRFARMLRPLAMGLGCPLTTPDRLGKPLRPVRRPRPNTTRPRPPHKPRAKKVTWKCAKPPHYGLEFSDPTLNLWHR
jgi:hypothetical protein